METFPDWPEFFADDVPVEISGDGPGDDEGEDAGLAGVVQSKESVEKRHLIVFVFEKLKRKNFCDFIRRKKRSLLWILIANLIYIRPVIEWIFEL